MTDITIAKNKPGKRFGDALAIQQGACNPSGVARSLVAAIDEFHNAPEFKGTQSVCDDPAIRLICHQLAFLLNIADVDHNADTYSKLTAACIEGDYEYHHPTEA